MLAVLAVAVFGGWSHGQERVPAIRSIPPDGLIVFKRHQQPDDVAPVVEYTRAQYHPTVINMKTKGGRSFSILRGQLVYRIDYPSPNSELLRDSHLTELKSRITEYGNVSKRFKRSAPLLKPWIAKLRQELTMWEQGYGRAPGGRWVNRSSYVFDQDRARLRAELERKTARILNAKKVPNKTSKLPPLWAEDMELQLAAEQAKFRAEFKKRIAEKKVKRAEDFQRRREQGQPIGPSLSKSGGLSKASGLDKSGSLISR